MEKTELLRIIKDLAAQGAIAREEVIAAYDEGAGVAPAPTSVQTLAPALTPTPTPAPEQHAKKNLGIAEVLYYIGGGIVVVGIAILVAENWTALTFPGRLAATLGASLGAYVIASIFTRDERFEEVGSAFYLISALTLPVGIGVVLTNAGIDTGSAGTQSLVAGLSFVFFLSSFIIFRKNTLALFSILFGTWFYFIFTTFLVGGNPAFDWTFFEYRTLVAGLSYLLIGYGIERSRYASLAGFLYGFGILGFLGAALGLGGWMPSANPFWELIFPGLALATLFVSIPLKRTSFLTFGTLFLMLYILKITQEYFTNGLGWPFALVLAGLILIAVGYLYVYLRRRYVAA